MTEYDAFISYSHRDARGLGPQIQAKLHRIGKPWYQLRACRVFLDETDLSAAPDAWGRIEEGLKRSRYLVLLASPEAQRSKWVNKEVEAWLAMGREPATIVIALIAGSLTWRDASGSVAGDFDWAQTDGLPRALSGVFASEPLWIDLREASRYGPENRSLPSFHKSCARIAAVVRGVELDTLISEDHRLQRQSLRFAVAAVIIVLSLAVVAVVQTRATAAAERQREREQAGREAAQQEARTNAELAAARDTDSKLAAAGRASLRGKFAHAHRLAADADQTDPRVEFAMWALGQHLAYPVRSSQPVDARGFGSIARHPVSGEFLAITNYDPHQIVVIDPTTHTVVAAEDLDPRLIEVSATAAAHTFHAFGSGLEQIVVRNDGIEHGARDVTGATVWFSGTNLGVALVEDRVIELRLAGGDLVTRELASLEPGSRLQASTDRTLAGVRLPLQDFDDAVSTGASFQLLLGPHEDRVAIYPWDSADQLFLVGGGVVSRRGPAQAFDLIRLSSGQTWPTRSVGFKPWPGIQMRVPGNDSIVMQEIGDTSHETVASMAVLDLPTGQDLLAPFVSDEPVWSATTYEDRLYLTGQGGWLLEVDTGVDRVRSLALPSGVDAPVHVRGNELLMPWSLDLDGNAWIVDTDSLTVRESDPLTKGVEYELDDGAGIIDHECPFVADVSTEGQKLAFATTDELWIVDLTEAEQALARVGRLDLAKACQEIVEQREHRSIWYPGLDSPQNLRWVSETKLAVHGFHGHAILVDTNARHHETMFESEALRALSRRGPVLFSTLSGTIYAIGPDGHARIWCRASEPTALFPLDDAGRYLVAASSDPERTGFGMCIEGLFFELASFSGPGAPIDVAVIGERVFIVYDQHLRVYGNWVAGRPRATP